jgi:hypothetical protein
VNEDTRTAVEGVLVELSESLEEGVHLEFGGKDGSVATVSLVIDPTQCEECLTPPSVLEAILLKRFRERGVDVGRVMVVDSPPAHRGLPPR